MVGDETGGGNGFPLPVSAPMKFPGGPETLGIEINGEILIFHHIFQPPHLLKVVGDKTGGGNGFPSLVSAPMKFPGGPEMFGIEINGEKLIFHHIIQSPYLLKVVGNETGGGNGFPTPVSALTTYPGGPEMFGIEINGENWNIHHIYQSPHLLQVLGDETGGGNGFLSPVSAPTTFPGESELWGIE